MTGPETRKWLEQNVNDVNCERLGERRRIQSLVDTHVAGICREWPAQYGLNVNGLFGHPVSLAICLESR